MELDQVKKLAAELGCTLRRMERNQYAVTRDEWDHDQVVFDRLNNRPVIGTLAEIPDWFRVAAEEDRMLRTYRPGGKS
jgi:hypothetical protein